MRKRTNELIRAAAEEQGVRLWQIADELGMNDGNFSRKLRHELPPEETARILAVIDCIASYARIADGIDRGQENA